MSDGIVYLDDPFTIEIEIDCDDTLSGATGFTIEYQKPDGTEGSFNAFNSGQYIYYNVSGTENDSIGDWIFQAYFYPAGSSEKIRSKSVIVTVNKKFT